MKTARERDLKLRARLAEVEDTLRAIRSGEVDAVMVAGEQGDQVFTLEGAEHAYRVLIESMNEGALTLTKEKVILYANEYFAKMVKCPLEDVIGGSFRRFLSTEDRKALRRLMKQPKKSGAKIRVLLYAGDGSQTPAQISLCSLARNGSNRAFVGMVVTNLTELRRTEELLRALMHRVVQAQEAERGRVALELHDNITQLLCALHLRSRALANGLPERGGPSRTEALKLCEMLGKAAGEVERVSRNLRPSLLDQLGLIAVLRSASREFANRAGVPVKLLCNRLPGRLPADAELAFYRIFQEALRNVERHARARNVTVRLRRQGAFVLMAISDNGVGFDPELYAARQNGEHCLGLIGMRERAASAGGVLTVKSVRCAGTKIEARIPIAR